MKKVAFIILTFLFLFSSVACSNKADIDDSVITIGASVVPHAAILEVVREELLRQGYTLKIVEFTDYVLPNTSLQAKELDANFFQHVPYLTFFNQSNNTDLVSVAAIHFEPFGIYKGTEQDLIDLPRKTKIAIPNDQSNRARALLLLEAQGLLTIRAGAGLSASINDITSNPLELEIIELEAAGIPARLADVGLAVINGNYAISANVTSLLIVSELPTSLAATTFANIIVVRRGDENKPAILALISALQSEVVRSFILQNYPNAVYPVF
jgi:D-methionine transport system substrate-binding protein